MRHDWHGGHHEAWTWIVPGIITLLFGLVLVAVLVLLWRTLAQRTTASGGAPQRWPAPGGAPAAPPAPTPEQVLADRLARGEIDVDEYRLRLAALHGGAPPPPA